MNESANSDEVSNSVHISRRDFIKAAAAAAASMLLAACAPETVATPDPLLNEENAINKIEGGTISTYDPQHDFGLQGSGVYTINQAQTLSELSPADQTYEIEVGSADHKRKIRLHTPSVINEEPSRKRYENGKEAIKVEPKPHKAIINHSAVDAFVAFAPKMCDMLNRAKPGLQASIADLPNDPDADIFLLPFGNGEQAVIPSKDLWVIKNGPDTLTIEDPAGITARFDSQNKIISQASHREVELNLSKFDANQARLPISQMVVEMGQILFGDPKKFGQERDEEIANGADHAITARNNGLTYDQYSSKVKDVLHSVGIMDPIISEEDYNAVPIIPSFVSVM